MFTAAVFTDTDGCEIHNLQVHLQTRTCKNMVRAFNTSQLSLKRNGYPVICYIATLHPEDRRLSEISHRKTKGF